MKRAVLLLILLLLTSGALAQEQEFEPRGDGLDRLRAEHRSARKAVVMSMVFPGWGQLYADSPFWASLASCADALATSSASVVSVAGASALADAVAVTTVAGGGAAWRYGLANVARRGRESVVQVVAFGLGLMVLLLLSTVRTDLMNTWRQSLPENAPNQFLINIQPHEVEGMEAFLAENGIEVPRFVPLVRARMTTINNENVTQMTFEDPQGERWARRDSNLSWAADLQADNRIVAGEIWGDVPDGAEVSVEQDFGRELGLSLGDEVGFNIAGETVTATVTNFRTVEWDSFSPNFFMVFSPGVLDGYPATYISSVYLDENQKRVVLDMMREFPSVTAIDLDAVLGQVRDVMDKAALAVQAVFVFTLLAGLTVLWAAVQATRDERRYESAMLRTFGASRKRVLGGVAAEFIAIGLLAGILAAAGATLAGWLLAENLFELDYGFSATLWLAGPLAGVVFVGLSGMAATWRVVTHAPVSVLRAA